MMKQQKATLSQASLRFFHAEHNHDHDHDHGHDDFKAKSKAAPKNEQELNQQLKEWVEKNDIVLFMKGNKKMPRCGFSNYVT
jgi:G3E family GTPase